MAHDAARAHAAEGIEECHRPDELQHPVNAAGRPPRHLIGEPPRVDEHVVDPALANRFQPVPTGANLCQPVPTCANRCQFLPPHPRGLLARCS